MESGASDHTGWNRKRIIECVLEWFGISHCINISVKSLLCSIKRLQIPIYKRSEFCEECNRKVLSAMNSSAKNQTLPAELFLVIALPDVTHLGKSLNCSWADQFIDLEGAISNFVSIRALRDSGSVDIRRKLRKCLTLDCVRNKDRMAVESIVHLTRPAVLYVLEEVNFVVLHRSARKVSLLEIKSNQVKRPLYAKDSSPLNVEPKVKLLLGL